jgi:ribose transport system permease protein
MKKLAGIVFFLGILYVLLLCAPGEGAGSYGNHFNLGRRIGLYGILTLAAGLVIVTGNIDLSMGSVIGLCSTATCMLLVDQHWNPTAALLVVLAMGAVIGLINGILVTYLRVQAFVVTLCGMFIYRGLARWIASGQNKGLGGEFREWTGFLVTTDYGVPIHLMVLAVLLVVAGAVLHLSVLGRYFFAIGSNERAARFSGIAADRYKILAFVLCSTLTALYSLLYVFTYNSVQPSGTGNMDELYAIAGAVLGGFSLRGGEGTVLGALVGTCIIQILPNMTGMWNVSSDLEPVVIGLALLFGATVDEILRRRRSKRKG